MTPIDTLSLFVTMVALAALPSTSVALVVTRAATAGVADGLAVAAGIVTGDLVFVVAAVLGLAVIAEAMGSLFVVIKILGGLYLVGLGITLLRSQGVAAPAPGPRRVSLAASFGAGLAVTLGDVKAIFFYLSLFPAFVDLAQLGRGDFIAIMVVTIVAVGGVKAAYALGARRLALAAASPRFVRTARTAAGGCMVGAGGWLLVKA